MSNTYHFSEIEFYTLLALKADTPSNKIGERILEISNGKVVMKKGTLHNLLIRLESMELIRETGQVNEKTRRYMITSRGNEVLLADYDMLVRMIYDASAILVK